MNKLRFDKFEHLFIYNLDGLCLVNPKKELVGTNRFNVKDKKGEYSLRNSLNFVKERKADFRSYNATVKLNDELLSNEKISYLKLYDKWGWMIGSGFYLENLNNKLEKKRNELRTSNEESIKSILFISLVITLIFIIFSFFISNRLKNRFNSFRRRIREEINEKVEKEKLLIQQSKMATMGEMLSSIAHQWKQPISVILMSNSLLKINRENKGFSTDDDIDNAISGIDNSVKNLTQTIDDFRDFFNPNKERDLFKINNAISETLKLISSQFKNNNIEIIQSVDDIELFGSQNELQQILINLLKNSKEELVKKDKEKKRLVFINFYIENEIVMIKVKDNADGIPKDIIEKVFDSYFTTKEKDGGSGIGLYICKQIVENSMKGSITVSTVKYEYENEIYNGAEFIISIPIDIRDN